MEKFALVDNYNLYVYDIDFKYIWHNLTALEQNEILKKGVVIDD